MHLSSGTLKRWRQAEEGPPYHRLSYQIIRYRKEALDEFLNSRKVTAESGNGSIQRKKPTPAPTPQKRMRPDSQPRIADRVHVSTYVSKAQLKKLQHAAQMEERSVSAIVALIVFGRRAPLNED